MSLHRKDEEEKKKIWSLDDVDRYIKNGHAEAVGQSASLASAQTTPENGQQTQAGGERGKGIWSLKDLDEYIKNGHQEAAEAPKQTEVSKQVDTDNGTSGEIFSLKDLDEYIKNGHQESEASEGEKSANGKDAVSGNFHTPNPHGIPTSVNKILGSLAGEDDSRLQAQAAEDAINRIRQEKQKEAEQKMDMSTDDKIKSIEDRLEQLYKTKKTQQAGTEDASVAGDFADYEKLAKMSEELAGKSEEEQRAYLESGGQSADDIVSRGKRKEQVRDLESQIEQLEKKKAGYEREKAYQEYASAEDFEENATYQEEKEDSYLEKIWGSDKGQSDTYRIINVLDKYRDKAEEDMTEEEKSEYISALSSLENRDKDIVSSVGHFLADIFDTNTDESNTEVQEMSHDEVRMYNYIYNTKGAEEAEAYLKDVAEGLNYKAAQKESKVMEGHPVLEVLGGIGTGLDQFKQGGRAIVNGMKSDTTLPTSKEQYQGGMYREDLEGKGPKILGNSLGQMAYDVVNTSANMIPSIVTSAAVGVVNPAAGEIVGASLLGASAGGNSFNEEWKKGVTKSQAAAYGITSGVSEATMQYVLGGISKLGGKGEGSIILGGVDKLSKGRLTAVTSKIDDAIGKALKGDTGKAIYGGTKELGAKMFEEGREEYLQDALDPIFRNITLGEDNDCLQGFVSADSLYSGLLGAISGGMFAGGEVVSHQIEEKVYRNIGENVDESQMEGLLEYARNQEEDLKDFTDSYRVDATEVNAGKLVVATEKHLGENILGAKSLEEAQAAYEDMMSEYAGNAFVEKIATEAMMEFSQAHEIDSQGEMDSQAEMDNIHESDAGQELQQTLDENVMEMNAPSMEELQGQVDMESGMLVNDATYMEDNIGMKLAEETARQQEEGAAAVYDPASLVQERRVAKEYMNEANARKINSMAEDMDTNTAKVFRQNWKGTVTPEVYQEVFETVKQAAINEVPIERIAETTKRPDVFNIRARRIGQEAIQYMYFAGENELAKVTEKTMSSEEVQAVDAIAKSFGKKVHMMDSISNGFSGANGMYQNGEIYISRKSTNRARTVLAHETTHMMKDAAAEHYQNFEDYIISNLKEQGEYDSVVEQYRGKVGSEDIAVIHEEIAADTTETFFDNPDKFMDFAKSNTSAAQKLVDIVSDLIDKIKTAIKKYAPGSRVAKLLQEEADTYTEARDIWYEGIQELMRQNAEGESAPSGDNDVKHSVKSFSEQFDHWDRKNPKKHFTLGKTPGVLQKIGIPEKNVTMAARKLIKIMNKHPEMTENAIKQIPEVLENPMVVMDSLTSPGRVVILGDAVMNDNRPMLLALELNPSRKGKVSENEIVIASAYVKDHAQNLINKSKIYYINEDIKKTKDWLGRTRLQLPVGPNQFGHINIISNVGEKSNSNIKNTKKNIGKNGEIKYSLKEIPPTIQKDVVANRRTVVEMEAVATIPDTLFARGEKKLSEQVEDFFAEKGNNAYNNVIGDVELNHRGVMDDIAHGMGRIKAITFGAVPEVIEKGKVIDYQKNWKKRDYDTVVIAAPTTVTGKSEYAGEYLTAVIAIRDEGIHSQRFYVHEALTIKKEEVLSGTRNLEKGDASPLSGETSFKAWTTNNGDFPGNTSSDIFSLLQKTLNYKWEDRKISSRNIDGGSASKYSLKEIPPTIQKDVVANRRTVAEMEAVATIPDTLFARGEKKLSEQVEDFFAEKGNNAYNNVIGDVELNRKGVMDDIAHGMGRVKAITFGAVPEVIEKGKVIDYQKNWKGRSYDTVVIAAPVKIKDKNGNTEEYLTAVIAQRNIERKNQRFYVHEALSIKKEELLFKTVGPETGIVHGNNSSPIFRLLQKTINYKWEDTKFSLKNTEGDSLFSSKKDDFAWMEEILAEEDSVEDTASILQEGVKSMRATEKSVDEAAVRKITREILEETGSMYDEATLEDNLEKVFSYMESTDNVSYGDMVRVMTEVALPVVDEIGSTDAQAQARYDKMVQYLKKTPIALSESQREEITGVADNVKFWMNRNVDIMKFRKDGVTLDAGAWSELVRESGNILPPNTNEAEMPIVLSEFVRGMKPQVEYYGVKGAARENLAYDVALKIFKKFYGDYAANQKVRAALDNKIAGYKKKVQKETARAFQREYANTIKQLQADKEILLGEAQDLVYELQQARREKDKSKEMEIQEELDRLNEEIKDLKAVHREDIARIKAKNHATWLQRGYRKKETELRNKIKKVWGDLQKKVVSPTESSYVPEGMVKAVMDVCTTVDIAGSNKMMAQKLTKLRDIYETIKPDSEKAGIYDDLYDNNIHAQIKELQNNFQNRSLKELSYNDLRSVYETMNAVKKQIIDSAKLIGKNKSKEAYQRAQDEITIIRDVKRDKTSEKALDGLLQSMTKQGLSPMKFKSEMKRLTGYQDGSVLVELADDFNKGSIQKKQIEMEVEKIFDDALSNEKEVNKTIGKKESDWIQLAGYVDKNGNPVMIPRSMMLSLAMHMENKGNMKHVIWGGIRVPNAELYRKGKIAEAYDKGPVLRLVDVSAYGDRNIDRGAIEEDCKKKIQKFCNDNMTENEKKILAASKKFFHEYSGKKINDTSLQLKGYKIARVKNYFPISTDKNFVKSDVSGLIANGTIEGMGILKQRVSAKNPVNLESIFDVIERHTENVGSYAGYAIPVRNFNKIYNTSMVGYQDSVSNALANVWGEEGKTYIKNFLTDVQGGRSNGQSNFFMKLRGNYAQAILTGNPSVMIKQAASLPTAAATLGWGAIMKALPHFGVNLGSEFTRGKKIKADFDKIGKYTPLFWDRTNAAFDSELMDIKKSRTKIKIPVLKQFAEAFLKGIEKVDEATVGSLWYAAESRVKKENKSLKVGSDLYYEKVAELFNEAVLNTQPMYDVTQQADISRNPNALVKAVFMFKTQPMQNFNILYDATAEYHNKKRLFKEGKCTEESVKEARNKFILAVTSQLASAVTFASMTLAAKKLLNRGDDDEDILADMVNNTLSSIAGSFVFGSELYEMVSKIITGETYFGVEVSIISNISDMAGELVSLRKAINEYGDTESKEEKTAGRRKMLKHFNAALDISAQIFGIPAGNVKKLSDAVTSRAVDWRIEDIYQADEAKEAAKKAYEEGDVTREKLYDALDNGERTKKQIDSGIKQALVDNDSRIEEAARLHHSGDLEEYRDKVEEVKQEGFSQNEVLQAVEAKERKLFPEKEKESEKSKKEILRYG